MGNFEFGALRSASAGLPAMTMPWEAEWAVGLGSLVGDARLICTDVGERRDALERITAALDARGGELESAVRRVDDAIVAALEAVGFPRGPAQGVIIDDAAGLGPAGKKTADCAIVIYADRLRQILRAEGGPDAASKTWVHESIHARQPFAPDHRREYVAFPGYEEGLAEGPARAIVGGYGRPAPPEQSYRWYVAGYRTAAEVFNVELSALWGNSGCGRSDRCAPRSFRQWSDARRGEAIRV